MSIHDVALTTHRLDLDEASVVYDLRGDLAAATAETPALFMVGTPMTAEGFTTLAGHFTDRPVITYDPRNTGRSRCTTDRTPTPADHAADLLAVIDAVTPQLGHDRVDILGSSGGAINALALAQTHTDRIRVLVAHEPPACPALPDADVLLRACAEISDSYQRAGFGVGLTRFIMLTSYQGQVGEDYLGRPDPDPSPFGLPADDDGSRDDAMMANMATIPVWAPDYEALAGADCDLVLAVGEESGETLAARAPRAIAERLGLTPVTFPGDHSGFLGGEFGQMGRPVEFAARLHEVLDQGGH